MDAVRRLIFPDKCAVCGDVTLLRVPLCRDCMPLFGGLFIAPCPGCGEEREFCKCYNNLKNDIPFLFYYHGKIAKRFLTAVKHKGSHFLMRFIAELVVFNLKKTKFDCVAYPPRSKKNIKKYGYDQSFEIAKEISKLLDIPCVPLLYRKRRAPEQKLLSASQRRKNLQNIFGTNDVKYKNILLFDDVITTGATVNECAKMLRSAGASRVKVACIAKTPKARRVGFKKSKLSYKYYN